MESCPMAELAVINSSPFIFLARGGHLDLLPNFYNNVMMPQQVADELLVRGSEDPAARAIEGSAWLHVTRVDTIPASIEAWGLGAGESAVLALAAATPGADAIIDDLAGRKCGVSLNLHVRGTLGLVLLAKKKGMIPECRPVMEDLMRGGMYLSRRVLDEALKRVGE
jgi:predicted nucleic acid-binding protein